MCFKVIKVVIDIIEKVLSLKREIYVNEIKHFSACIENTTRKNTVLLSEKALNDELYMVIDKEAKLVNSL